MHVLRVLLIVLLFSTVHSNSHAQDPVAIDRWLVLGPAPMPIPAFADDDADAAALLDAGPVDDHEWWPRSGESIAWHDGRRHVWSEQSGDAAFAAIGGRAALGWAAAYIDVDRWQKARLIIETRQPTRLYVNGLAVASKASRESDDADAGSLSQTIEFMRGRHLLLVKIAADGGAFQLSARLEPVEPEDGTSIRVETHPERTVRIQEITDAPTPTNVSMAPAGDLVAVTITRRIPPEGTTDARIEIRSTVDGSLRRTYAGGMGLGSIEWAPTGRRFSYVERSGEKSSLWLVDLDAGTQERLLQDVERLGSHRWSPGGSYIVYTLREDAEENTTGVRRMDYLESRRPGFHHRSHLYRLNLPHRTTQRLSGGDLSTSFHDISHDGRRLLVSRSHIRYDERPFGVSEYAIIDVESLQVDSLFTVPFAGRAQFSPDARQVLVTGGPSAFGDVGTNLPTGTVPNDYDTQAYLYDVESGDVRSLTRDFDPAVSLILWDEEGGSILMSVTEASYGRMYRYDIASGLFSRVEVEGDVLAGFSKARHAPLAAYISSGISSPPKAWLLDLSTGRSTQLADPASDVYAAVRFGDVRDWTFTNARGDEIDGHVYYPPDFDESRTYPVIVYYYGGTTPVTRDFAGRYPKELWAANGYLVYVLQPSGAIGYGQEFSALHVNDWGEIVADEIIDGVEQFLAAHPFADGDRVGAIGASFGGFMTMLLQTRTDLFAAAVSHAGISNIASYWGEGFWGFQYSAVATADSYPWNRPDVYVDRSPLFAADRITTPLLLLHGAADTNVPVGESLQMFTALKLLGRDVEYVEIADQDHHILDYEKRIIWTNTILAWFDRWLKNQSEWWEDMF